MERERGERDREMGLNRLLLVWLVFDIAPFGALDTVETKLVKAFAEASVGFFYIFGRYLAEREGKEREF